MTILQLKKIAFLFLFCPVISCAPKKAGPQESVPVVGPLDVVLTEEQFKIANIQLGDVQPRHVSGLIKVNGMLDVPPQNLVTISAPLGGFVMDTKLLQGMKVIKGQVVAVMENPNYIQLQEDYLVNKSQLEFLQLEYERQSELAKENVNAAKALQQSRSNYLGTQAKVEGLTAKLRLINIDPSQLEKGAIQNTICLYTPISGFVTQVNVNIGMYVNPSDVMFRIINTEDLHAEAQVFEKDITKVKVGQLVRLKLANDAQERLAIVYLIGREVTPERTVRVHCHFEKEDPLLIPGMYFSAVIETDQQSVPTLPDEAVVHFEGKKYVFVSTTADTLQFKMIEIKTATSESGFTQVMAPETSNLHHVVIRGAYELLSKMKNNEQ